MLSKKLKTSQLRLGETVGPGDSMCFGCSFLQKKRKIRWYFCSPDQPKAWGEWSSVATTQPYHNQSAKNRHHMHRLPQEQLSSRQQLGACVQLATNMHHPWLKDNNKGQKEVRHHCWDFGFCFFYFISVIYSNTVPECRGSVHIKKISCRLSGKRLQQWKL